MYRRRVIIVLTGKVFNCGDAGIEKSAADSEDASELLEQAEGPEF